MFRQVMIRVLSVIPLLFTISVLLFILISLLPGDAGDAILAETGTEEDIERIREGLGLSRPFYIQYADWLINFTKGNWGNSFLTNQSVFIKFTERLPVTLELALISMFFATLFAIPSGVIAAVNRNTIWDNLNGLLTVIGVSMPAFWLGMLLILLFSIKLGILPASGYVPFFLDPIQNIKSLIMPAFCIGFSYAATLSRQTRSAMLDVLSEDYIVTARVKGASEKVVIWKHALRNAIIPIITIFALKVGRLIGNTVVIETIFVLPGISRAIVDGVLGRDYPVVMAFTLALASFIVFVNMIVDIVYIFIDPRISINRKID